MTKKQQLQLFGLCFFILTMILFLKSHKKNIKNEIDNAENQKSSIVCASINKENITPLIDFSGRISSKNKINIVSEVNGISQVSNMQFEVGQAFKKGEVLISIHNDDTYLELKALKSQFLSLLLQVIPDIKMDFPSLGMKFQSYINNFSLEKNISEIPKTSTAKQRNFLAARQIFANYYTIKSLEKRLEKFQITAPFDGIVTKALIDLGSNVIIGQPLGEFISINSYEIHTSVSVNESKFIKVGNSVLISSEDLNNQISGSISRIGSHINELTQSIDVFIETNNEFLKDGMYATGQIFGDTLLNVYKIERSKLLNNSKIYIIENNKLKTKSVNMLIFQNDNAIISGLDENSCVVNEYRNYFYDGMIIK